MGWKDGQGRGGAFALKQSPRAGLAAHRPASLCELERAWPLSLLALCGLSPPLLLGLNLV